MIQIAYAENRITFSWIAWGTGLSGIYATNAKDIFDILQSWFVVSPQFDFELNTQYLLAALAVASQVCSEMAFTISKASEPMAKIIGNFQIKSQSSLHDSLPRIKPTSPQFVLPAQTVGGQRADGPYIQSKDRFPFEQI